MASPLSLTDPKAYHIISYSTFLGATFFQTFLGGPLAFKALPRPMFARLQQTTVPSFFTLQTILSVAILLSYPGERQLAVGHKELRVNQGISGLTADGNFYHVLVPMLLIFSTSAFNLLVGGPLTTKTMKDRFHQETRDGKKSYDAGPHSEEMRRLNKRFGILHSISSLLDLTGFIAAVYYGFVLGSRL